MYDFEKLGAFYLGKRYDMEAQKLTDEPVLYDSKDLTTHAAIIGMTGSGKTGLGIGILDCYSNGNACSWLSVDLST